MNMNTFLIILAVIIFLIIPSLKPRTVNIRKLIIIPVVFLYFLQQCLTDAFHITATHYWLVGLGGLFGILTGVLSKWNTSVAINKTQQSISLPASYLNLITFLMIFTVHYLIGYLQATDIEFFTQQSLSLDSLLLFLAFASTINAGSSLLFIYRYHEHKEITC